jgi:hypothetical protein
MNLAKRPASSEIEDGKEIALSKPPSSARNKRNTNKTCEILKRFRHIHFKIENYILVVHPGI